MTDFDDLVDTDDLDEAEEARLRRMHDLLVQAGPPPELSPALLQPPGERPEEADVFRFPLTIQGRRGALFVGALAAAAVVLAVGFALGHARARPAPFAAQRVVGMTGVAGSTAAIRIGAADSVGNVPMLVTVRGLPPQPHPGDYYELWLTRNGKPVEPCGGFRVHGSTTTVRLSVPYRLDRTSGWVVTSWQAGHRRAGPVVMRTA